jgi:hypothetical protein
VVPQGLVVILPFFLFGDFRSLFFEFPWGRLEGVSLRNSCWISRMRTLCLFAWWSWSNKPSETASIWVFSVVYFRFLLIEWALGTELLAKCSPRGTPTIPKVSLWSVERIGRTIAWSFEFFPRIEFFPTVQAKTGLTGFPNWSDRFSPVGCPKEFLTEKVPVMLWLFFLKGGEVLEVGFLSKGSLGSFWTELANRSDRFPLPMWG